MNKLAFGLSVVLVGCGGDSSSPAPESESAAQTPASERGPRVHKTTLALSLIHI